MAPSGPGGNTPGNTPASTPGSTPESAPQNSGPSNPQAVPPVLDLDAPKGDPVIPVGAQDPVAGPKNTVAEPSSLALLGIAALGLVLRRRRRA